MLTYFGEFDRLLDDFRGLFRASSFEPRAARWGGPVVGFVDDGEAYKLTAHVPGLSEEDLDLGLEGQVLTLKAARKTEVPAGYRPLRRERRHFELSRSYRLPSVVDADNVSATLTDGVLTVTLPKTPEQKPRRIAIGGDE